MKTKKTNADKFLKEKRIRTNLNEPRPFKYNSQPERIPSDFQEMYKKHFDLIAKRLSYLQTKAIHLHALNVKSEKIEASIESQQYWYDVASQQASIYGESVIQKFYTEGFETSEYYNAINKVAKVYYTYQETFPEYFV